MAKLTKVRRTSSGGSMKYGFGYTFWISYVVWLRSLLAQLEQIFEVIGRKVAKNPKKTIFIALLCVALCAVGLLRLRTEVRSEKLFVPTNSVSNVALQKGESFFPNALNRRTEEIVFLPKNGTNILEKDCIMEAMRIFQLAQNITRYRDLCKRRPRFMDRGSRRVFKKQETCSSMNPLEILTGKESNVVIYRKFQRAVSNTAILMSNGRAAIYNFNSGLPGFSIDRKNSQVYAKALRIEIYLMQGRNESHRSQILEWEKEFIASLKQVADDQKHVRVTFSAERSLDDAIMESSSKDISLISITFAMMITFSCIMLAKFINPVRGHTWLALSGVLSTGMGILAGIGVTVCLGVPFISLVGIVPFLVVSIGIDDMFIIVDEFDRQSKSNIPMNRVAFALSKVGATITMTTVTDVIAFLVSATSTFPAIRYFCIYTAICISIEFLLQITLFVAFLSFDSRRIFANRNDCCPSLQVQDRTCCKLPNQFSWSSRIMRRYGELLVSWPGKTVVCILTLALFVFGLYGCLHVNNEFNRKTLAPEGSYYAEYLQAFEGNFPQTVPVSIQITNKLNYSDPRVREQVSDLPRIAYNTGYYLSQNVTWTDYFDGFLRQFSLNGNGARFKMAINVFLSLPVFSQHNADVILDKDGQIAASRSIVFLKDNPSSTFQKDAMLTLRSELKKYSALECTVAADPFIYFEQYAVVTEEVRNNLLFISFIITVLLIPFCIHPLIIFFVVLGFFLLVLELFGLMYFWGVHLNAVSMINLVMSVGFTVDYSTHIAHAFVASTAESVNARIIDALSTVGGSVFLGGISTLLGMSLTGLASTAIFQIFFKMFLGIILFGLYNGFVLLPALLSIFSRYIDFRLNDVPHDIELLSPSRVIRKTLSKIMRRNAKPANRKAISIVGMSTRFPTAPNKAEFLKLLENCSNTTTKYPEDRYGRGQFFEDSFNPARPVSGKLYVSNGSYLENIEKFDHQFFGISATEAKSMDPQQRMLLQGVYEAVEDAGMTLDEAQQCTTGVYVGIMNLDYSSIVLRDDTLLKIDQFASTGTAFSIAANRISFSLNLTGPSIAIDTACSSSMTALSLACDHLEKGIVDVAIVAAANLILCPRKQTTICRANMLAPDGKCKVFDETADGYGRGEAIAAFVLKATDLVSAKDEPYAEIIGWGINNDGQSAAPITAPSVESQRDLMIDVLQQANVHPKQLHFVEMHGTGTIIGDMVETKSVGEVYGKPRENRNPVPIGSIKSNINHTESAAGLAGLAKVCLMMEKGKIFPTVGLENLAIRLDIEERGLRIPTTIENWQVKKHEVKLAAINSFGYGGSNAHLVVREAPKIMLKSEKISGSSVSTSTEKQPLKLIVLSARSLPGLVDTAKVFGEWFESIEDSKENLESICYTVNERRTIHNVRLAVASESLNGFAKLLSTFADDKNKANAGYSLGRTQKFGSSVAFVFGGQGSQWLGMAGDLIREPRILHDVKKINKYAKKNGHKRCLLAYLMDAENVDQTDCLVTVQLSIFALQYAVANFLESRATIEPLAVGGHSLGDITAACVARIIKPKKAVKIIMARASLQEQCHSEGAMAALGLSSKEATSIFKSLSLEGKICIAAENDKESITISGDKDAIDQIEKYIKENYKDTFWRKLATHKAFHSHHMDAIENEFMAKIRKANIKPKTARTLFVSTTEGKQMNANEIDECYWWRNIRNSVQFNACVKKILSTGIRVIVEISPRPVLSHYMNAIAKQMDIEDLSVIQALPARKETERLKYLYARCIGQMYTIGYPISINLLQDQSAGRFLRFPLYPWQETDLWADDEYNAPTKTMHLIGMPTSVNNQMVTWENEIDLHRFSYLNDHVMKSSGVILPGACYVELALEAFIATNEIKPAMIKGIKFNNVLPLHEHVIRQIKCVKERSAENESYEFKVIHVTDKGEINLSTATSLPFDGIRSEKTLTLQDALTSSYAEADDSSCFDNAESTKGSTITFEKDASSHSNSMDSCTLSKRSSGEISIKMDEVTGEINDNEKNTNMSSEESIEMDPLKNFPEDDFVLKALGIENVEKVLSAKSFKDLAGKSGFQFGECFSLIEKAWSCKNSAVVRLQLPKKIKEELGLYVMHPCIIDACLQSCIAMGSNDPERDVIPIGINCVRLNPIRRETRFLYAFAEVSSAAPDTCDVKFVDDHANVILYLQGFTVKEISRSRRLPSMETSIYEMGWLPSEADTVADDLLKYEKIVIVGFKSSPISSSVMNALVEIGFPNQSIALQELSGSEAIADFQEKVLKAVHVGEQISEKVLVISLLPLFAYNASKEDGLSFTALWLSFETTLEILKFLSKNEMRSSKVAAFTYHSFGSGMHAEDGHALPWAATVLGMARVTNIEVDIPLVPIDVGIQPSEEEIKAALLSLSVRSAEEGLVVTPSSVYQPMFQRVKQQALASEMLEVTQLRSDRMFYLSWSERDLTYCVKKDMVGIRCVPDDNVIIDIKHISLPAGHSVRLLENVKSIDSNSLLQCASGVIIEAPANALGLNIGDEIVTVYNSKWVRSRLQMPIQSVTRKPPSLSSEQAAILTGCMALAENIIGKVAAGPKAINDIFVYSTKTNRGLCSTIEKVAKQKGLNVTYEDEVSRWKENTGCTMAKISEHHMRGTSEFLNKFDCIIFSSDVHPVDHSALLSSVKKDGIILVLDNEVQASFTRYEICKSITVLNFKLFEAALSPNEFSSTVNNALADNLLKEAVLRPKDVRIHSVSDICNRTSLATLYDKSALFDCIGMETQSSKSLMCYPPSMDVQGLKEDRTYIVIGGSKGLGLNTVAWMAARGAGTIVPVGRSNLTEESLANFRKLEETHGSRIRFVKADASSRQGIGILEQELRQFPKVAGVVNSGAVLDDKLFQDVDRENYRKIMAPKISGTVLLNELLENQEDVDFFVLYSSITSVLGNNGQTVYSAANAFMNSFADFRVKVQGKPCLSICWGAMGGAGMLARNTNVAMLLEKSGLHLLDIPTGLKWMDQVLTNMPQRSNICICDVDWRTFLNSLPTRKSNSLIYDEIRKEIPQSEDLRGNILEMILKTRSSERRLEIITSYIKEWIAAWISGAAEEVDCNVALFSYGIDSVGATALKGQIEKDLQIDFQVFYFMQPETTITKLAQDLLKAIHEKFDKKAEEEEEEQEDEDDEQNGEEDALLASEEEDEDKLELPDDYLTPIYMPDGAQANLFLVHPSHRYSGSFSAFGIGLKYQKIFSLYVFGSQNPAYLGEDINSVSRLAKACISLLMEIQPCGPYFIGGYSFGGLVSLEMASMLEKAGHKVAFVVMIDTVRWVPVGRNNTKLILSMFDEQFPTEIHIKEQMEGFLRKIATKQLGMSLDEYQRKTKGCLVEEIEKILIETAEKVGKEIPDIQKILTSIKYDQAMAQTCHSEWLPPMNLFQGNVMYIEAQDDKFCRKMAGIGSSADCWSAVLLDRITTVTCPGDHYSMMDPSRGADVGKAVSLAAQLRFRMLFPQRCRIVENAWHKQSSTDFKQQGLKAIYVMKSANIKRAICGTFKLSKSQKRLRFIPDSKLLLSVKVCLRDVKNITKLEVHDVNEIKGVRGIEKFSLYAGYCMKTDNSSKFKIMCFNGQDYRRLHYTLEAIYRVKLPF